jgi:peroxiredoxin
MALKTGVAAPDISLTAIDGSRFSLAETLRKGPVVAAFFKVSCPTCQYTFPFLERLYQAYPRDKFALVGISQNQKRDTAAYNREYGVTFPVLLDPTDKYPVSNAYDLTHVPSIFFISPDGAVEFTSVGWDRRDFEELNALVARAAGQPKAAIFKPGEQVVSSKAG